MTTPNRTASPTDYLAAERTFLAWIRTALALMGFGFVVARFGLFLKEMQIVQPAWHVRSYGLSLPLGIILIALGVVVSGYASWRYRRLVHDFNEGGTEYRRLPRVAILLATLLALLGSATVVYLVSMRSTAH